MRLLHHRSRADEPSCYFMVANFLFLLILQVVPSPNGFTQLYFVGAANFGCVRNLSGFVLANMFDPTFDGQVFLYYLVMQHRERPERIFPKLSVP